MLPCNDDTLVSQESTVLYRNDLPSAALLRFVVTAVAKAFPRNLQNVGELPESLI